MVGRGVTNGALQLHRDLAQLRRPRLPIPARWREIGEGERLGRLSGERVTSWCAEIRRGRSAFIGERGAAEVVAVDDQDGVIGRERDGRAWHLVHGVTAFVTGILVKGMELWDGLASWVSCATVRVVVVIVLGGAIVIPMLRESAR